ncbi:UvrD-helicase domain-containing protein [Candidatus Xenohaliotis californiensis]
MLFYADTHVHSKYSRATSRNLDLENMYIWAKIKGINVVGTGDFTHPLWIKELKEKLIPTESGLFQLSPHITSKINQTLPVSVRNNIVLFTLQVEISTIYKKMEKVRKVHHVVLAPSFEAADKIIVELAKIGNLASDGRPILGLDSCNLLEIVKTSDPYSYLIPAHIWTPWFAALGSKSGFDSIDECYGTLSQEIFAVETGLSSDPPMNWMVGSLDRFRLVSNSDAHSPTKLAREATVYNTELSYFAIMQSLKTGNGYQGTLEFFPEEGKYHMDGHRKCHIQMIPSETKKHNGICPSCGNPITIGVHHRVVNLASRTMESAINSPPPNAAKFTSLIPLNEILSEIHKVGPGTKKVMKNYNHLINTFGSELSILMHTSVDELRQHDSSILAEAISRLRSKSVICNAGYDGEYGIIKLFKPDEINNTLPIFLPITPTKKTNRSLDGRNIKNQRTEPKEKYHCINNTNKFDAEQKHAVEHINSPLLIIAGPGSGKTNTLSHRICNMVSKHQILPENILAITFTNKAANEMRHRLTNLIPESSQKINIHTFHSMCLEMLQKWHNTIDIPADFQVIAETEKIAIITENVKLSTTKIRSTIKEISKTKYFQLTPSSSLLEIITKYDNILKATNKIDFDDLILMSIKMLEEQADICIYYQKKYQHISIDEYQDIDHNQYRLIKLIAGKTNHICAIGDPNQAIYSFRGADISYFHKFSKDYPNSKTITLKHNYRSKSHIIDLSNSLLGLPKTHNNQHTENILSYKTSSSHDAANNITKTIKKITGASDSLELQTYTKQTIDELSFSDIVILYRYDTHSKIIIDALNKANLPFKKHNSKPLMQSKIAEGIMHHINTTKPKNIADEIQKYTTEILNNENKSELSNISAKMIDLAHKSKNNIKQFKHEYILAEQFNDNHNINAINLMTLHSAKGLEFNVVFIFMPNDLIKHNNREKENAAEEKRLLYVGMTRAKLQLFLSWTQKSKFAPTIKGIKSIAIKNTQYQTPSIKQMQFSMDSY